MMRYTVGEIRALGIQAKWSRNRNGAPIIVARYKTEAWCAIDAKLWAKMAAPDADPLEVFECHTALIDVFSIPA